MLFGALALGAACLVAFPRRSLLGVVPHPLRLRRSPSPILFVMSEFWITAAAPEARRGLVMGIYATVLVARLRRRAAASAGRRARRVFAPSSPGAAVFALAAIPVALRGRQCARRRGPGASLDPLLPARRARGDAGGLRLRGGGDRRLQPAARLCRAARARRRRRRRRLSRPCRSATCVFQIPLGWLADRIDRIAVLRRPAASCGNRRRGRSSPSWRPAGGVPLYLAALRLGRHHRRPLHGRAVAARPALCRPGTRHGQRGLRGALQPRHARRPRQRWAPAWTSWARTACPSSSPLFFVGYCMAAAAGAVADRQRRAAPAS